MTDLDKKVADIRTKMLERKAALRKFCMDNDIMFTETDYDVLVGSNRFKTPELVKKYMARREEFPSLPTVVEEVNNY